MISIERQQPIEGGAIQFAPALRGALVQLEKAYRYARELECDLWDFAVEMDRLLALGLTTSDLRWMAKRGYVNHAREITSSSDEMRRFDPEQNLAFSPTTCFVFTELGLQLLRPEQAMREEPTPLPLSLAGDGAETLTPSVIVPTVVPDDILDCHIPVWNSTTRILQVGEQVVKHFRVPSPNQQAVLEAFQVEGWPHFIDDPLPPVPDQQPKNRLRDTIKSLNVNQTAHLLRFCGDGTGQRVGWQRIGDLASDLGRDERRLRRAA